MADGAEVFFSGDRTPKESKLGLAHRYKLPVFGFSTGYTSMSVPMTSKTHDIPSTRPQLMPPFKIEYSNLRWDISSTWSIETLFVVVYNAAQEWNSLMRRHLLGKILPS